MARVVCFTSFTYGYLARARILAQTLRAVHPDWRIVALVVDKPPPGLDVAGWFDDFDGVVEAERLAIPRFRSWLFKHDVVEACTAVKGQMLVELMEGGAEKVVYLDPDIAVFASLGGVERRLDVSSIIFTPHQVAPNEAERDILDNEIGSLRHGVFNLGFLAVRNDRNGRAFANWWAAQLRRACYDEVENGLFTDQKYCDLAPGLFDGVHIERNPGYNVASWNLSRRRLAFSASGDILVNGARLRFHHFTKIDGAGDLMTELYAGDNVEASEIRAWYRRRLRESERPGAPPGYWAYGRFANGEPIPKTLRVFYRRRPDVMGYFDDPFATGPGSFVSWVERNEPGWLASDPAAASQKAGNLI